MASPENISMDRSSSTSVEVRSTSGCESVTCRIITDLQTWESIRADWNDLVECSHATVFQTYEWLMLWWKHLGQVVDRSLHIVEFRRGGELVGIAPFFLEERRMIGQMVHRRLAFLGSGMAFTLSDGLFFDDGASDYLDFIIRPGFEQIVAEKFARLESLRTFAAIEFVSSPDESHVLRSIMPALRLQGFTCVTSRADICPYLPVPESMESFLLQSRASSRRKYRQSYKHINGDSPYEVQSPASLDDYRNLLQELISLHQQRWNKRGYPGLFSNQAFKTFQEDVLTAFHANGWLWGKSIRIDGSAVANRLAFRFGGTIYDYLSGFDDAASQGKHRPGLTLVMAMIEDSITLGLNRIDLLRGDEQYKLEMSSQARYVWNVRTTPPHMDRTLRAVSAIRKVPNLLRFLFEREKKLFVAQRIHSSFPGYFVNYLSFRAERLFRKMKNGAVKGSEGAREIVTGAPERPPLKTLALVVSSFGRPQLEELIERERNDEMPRVSLFQTTLNADMLDERMLANATGKRKFFQRLMPYEVAKVIEAYRLRRRYDGIVIWGERMTILFGLLLKFTRTRKPTVALVYWISKPKQSVLLRMCSSHIDHFITWSSVQRKYAIERLGIPAAKITYVPYQVDQKFFRPIEMPMDTICSVGEEMRDYTTLAEAMRGLDIPCHIVAGNVRIIGEYRSKWVPISAMGPFPPNVITSKMSLRELRDLYARSRFVVLPLLPSGTSSGLTVLLEAMAMGKAVICTRSNAQVDVIEEGKTGLFVPQGDARSLRSAIQYLWDTPEVAEEMGRAARRYVEQHHTIDNFMGVVRMKVEDSTGMRDKIHKPLRLNAHPPKASAVISNLEAYNL